MLGLAGSAGARRLPRSIPNFVDGRLPVWMILLLGALIAVGPLSTDMYLPAFPTLDAALGGGPGSTQITLGAWFAGLAIGQFTQGPFSDRAGRRLPLLIGMSIYTVGSLGCALAHGFWWFTAARFVAALGGSAGMVIPRTIVRDVATGPQGARIMSQLILVLGVVPILAPSLGGLVLLVASWRWIFWIATLYGVIAVAAVAWRLPDTLPEQNRLRLPPVEVLQRYRFILGDRSFLSNTMVASAASFVIFAYLSGSPIAFERILRFTPTQFAIVFGINAAFFIISSQINARLVHRLGIERLLQFGIRLLAVSALLLLGLTLTGLAGAGHPPIFVALPLIGALGSMGFITSNAVVGALAAHARHAGSASALLGTLQFAIGSLSGIAMGLLPVRSILPMAGVMMVGVVMMLAANRARRPRVASA